MLFADDAVVFAPSAKGLQRLLDLCSDFAVSHNVVFNVTKSQRLIIIQTRLIDWLPNLPPLWGTIALYRICYKYLDQLITSSLSDDTKLEATSLIVNLHYASLNTKVMFNAYTVAASSGV